LKFERSPQSFTASLDSFGTANTKDNPLIRTRRADSEDRIVDIVSRLSHVTLHDQVL
jgi:hypothetical protein